MSRVIYFSTLVFTFLLNGCYLPTQKLVERETRENIIINNTETSTPDKKSPLSQDCKDGFFKTNYYDSCMPKF